MRKYPFIVGMLGFAAVAVGDPMATIDKARMTWDATYYDGSLREIYEEGYVRGRNARAGLGELI